MKASERERRKKARQNVERVEQDPKTPIAQANRTVIDELLKRFNAVIDEYLTEVGHIEFVDAFMAAHNFHKIVIIDIADRVAPNDSTIRAQWYAMAAQNFAMAMQERAEMALRAPARDHIHLVGDEPS